MCVLAIAWRAHPRWLLVVAANRDERHDRAALPLARWPEGDIVAGRDLRAGGTWLGIADRGRFAAVTNVRGSGAADAALASRGRLVADLLASEEGADGLAVAPTRYNPFHAVLASPAGAWLISNRPAETIRPLPPGIHAVSNGPLDRPWRKTLRLRDAVTAWLVWVETGREGLLAVLRDPRPPAGSGDDPAALFIEDPVYGTRCSTLVMVDTAGTGRIVERRFDPYGRTTGDAEVRFAWR